MGTSVELVVGTVTLPMIVVVGASSLSCGVLVAPTGSVVGSLRCNALMVTRSVMYLGASYAVVVTV